MGRFDALTELEEKQTVETVEEPVPPLPKLSPASAMQEAPEKTPASSLSDHSPAAALPQTDKKQRASGKKQAPQQPGKSINALQLKQDKFDKYSTYLRPGYKKELKLLAAELDCKDYELIDEALTLYFANHKK